jgi:hypothetical protein
MVTSSPYPATDACSSPDKSRGVVVRRPREGDAIGNALRQSFEGAATASEEFVRYLRQLDRVPGQR